MGSSSLSSLPQLALRFGNPLRLYSITFGQHVFNASIGVYCDSFRRRIRIIVAIDYAVQLPFARLWKTQRGLACAFGRGNEEPDDWNTVYNAILPSYLPVHVLLARLVRLSRSRRLLPRYHQYGPLNINRDGDAVSRLCSKLTSPGDEKCHSYSARVTECQPPTHISSTQQSECPIQHNT